MTNADTPLAALRRRAADGALTPDDIHAVIGHLQSGRPDRVRIAAITVAGDYLAAASDAGIVVELIRIAESKDPSDDGVRTHAVRALARATEYKGQRIQLDL